MSQRGKQCTNRRAHQQFTPAVRQHAHPHLAQGLLLLRVLISLVRLLLLLIHLLLLLLWKAVLLKRSLLLLALGMLLQKAVQRFRPLRLR